MSEQLSFFEMPDDIKPEINSQECKPNRKKGRPKKENKNYQSTDGFVVLKRGRRNYSGNSKSLLENDCNKLKVCEEELLEDKEIPYIDHEERLENIQNKINTFNLFDEKRGIGLGE